MGQREGHRVVRVANDLEEEMSPAVVELLISLEHMNGLVILSVLNIGSVAAIDLNTGKDTVSWDIHTKHTGIAEWGHCLFIIPNAEPRCNSKRICLTEVRIELNANVVRPDNTSWVDRLVLLIERKGSLLHIRVSAVLEADVIGIHTNVLEVVANGCVWGVVAHALANAV